MQTNVNAERRFQREAKIYRMVVGVYMGLLLCYGVLTLTGVIR
jgi:hypothetical protein